MKRLGYITAGIIRDLRRRRNISRLCREWPRAMGEIIDEVGAKSGRMTAIEQRLEQCVDLLDAGVDDDGITVIDNGPGIPAETIADVLDFSVRVSSRETGIDTTVVVIRDLAVEKFEDGDDEE